MSFIRTGKRGCGYPPVDWMKRLLDKMGKKTTKNINKNQDIDVLDFLLVEMCSRVGLGGCNNNENLVLKQGEARILRQGQQEGPS